MKTKIQYPGGLAIIIEHEEQIVPQLLEVKEAVSASDFVLMNADLSGKNESLQRTVNEFETVVTKLENENAELRDTIAALRLENLEQGATIGSLKEEIQKLSIDPDKNYRHDVTIPIKTVPENKKKSSPKWSPRKCTKCGKMFQPNGPRGNTCTQCKAELSSLPDEKTEIPE